MTGDIPALSEDEASRIAQLSRSLLRPQASAKVSYGTEAGFFQRMGIPSIVCGPGSIEQAHRADEYVALEQLAECEAFLNRLVARLGASLTA